MHTHTLPPLNMWQISQSIIPMCVQVRECVKLDEERTQCWALYRKLKKLTKALDDMQGHFDAHR